MSAVTASSVPVRRVRVGEALRRAAKDFYRQSWRLAALNVAFSVAAAGVGFAAAGWLPAVALAVLLGPLVAAIVHCCVVLVQTEELTLREAVIGLRLHWRRGLALGALSTIVGAAGAIAVAVYAHAATYAWALAFLVGYLLIAFAVLQLLLWPLAIAQPERPLGDVAKQALLRALARPGALAGLALALLVVNLAGAALAVMPLLTLTVSYSFLAAAHFALPRPTSPEDGS